MNAIAKLSIILSIVLYSCNNSAELFEEGLNLKEVNDGVAKRYNAKLMFYYSKIEKDQLIIKIENQYKDEYVPSNILYDYFLGITAKKIKVAEYVVKNSKDSVLINLTTENMKSLSKDKERAEKKMTALAAGNISQVYNDMDTSITNNISLTDFQAQLKSLNIKKPTFNGFKLFDNFVGIRFSDNSNNQLFLIYDLKLDEERVMGVTVR